MVSRLAPAGALAALAGAAMFIAASTGPSSAFTLSSPSLEQPVVSADVQEVYWRHWGLARRLGLAPRLGLASPLGLGLASPVASGIPPLAALLVGPLGLPLPLVLKRSR